MFSTALVEVAGMKAEQREAPLAEARLITSPLQRILPLLHPPSPIPGIGPDVVEVAKLGVAEFLASPFFRCLVK
jgi:hypothetical protein